MIRVDERRDQNRVERRVQRSFVTDAAVTAHEGSSRPGASLMQQQCWLWGRDVRRAEGNLLVDYGFERTIPPQRDWGSTCYSFALPASATVRLWAFGVLYCDGETGGVFLERTAFEPKLVSLKNATGTVWKSEHINGARTPRLPGDSKKLLAYLPSLLAWIGAYEQWVLDTYGISYRLKCLETYPTKVCAPDQVPRHWWDMAANWRETLSH